MSNTVFTDRALRLAQSIVVFDVALLRQEIERTEEKLRQLGWGERRQRFDRSLADVIEEAQQAIQALIEAPPAPPTEPTALFNPLTVDAP